MPAARYGSFDAAVNEPTRRLWAGTEALARRHDGIAAVMRVIGLSRNTILRGIREASQAQPLDVVPVRAPGAGRKAKSVLDPSLKRALEPLVKPLNGVLDDTLRPSSNPSLHTTTPGNWGS